MQIATFANFARGVVLAILSGLAPALSPFYFKSDIAYDPELIGTFTPIRAVGPDGQAPPITETVSIQRVGSQGYRLIFMDEDSRTELEGNLFRLDSSTSGNKAYFFDLHESGLRQADKPHRPLPSGAKHLVTKVQRTSSGLIFSPIDHQWLGKIIEEQRYHHKTGAAIYHGGTGDFLINFVPIVLSGSTPELQDILRRGMEQGAFHASSELHRQSN